MGNVAKSFDYTRLEEVNLTSNKLCSSGKIIKFNNGIAFCSNPVSIRFDNSKKELNMTQGDPRDGVYNDIYTSVETLLSVDKKEQNTINRMAKKGYVVVGQLNEDGTYDKFAQAYVNYIGEKNGTIIGAIEGLSSRPRNQKIIKNDGNAFVFAYLPEIAKQKLEEQKKLASKRINVMQEVFKMATENILSDGESIANRIINATKK